MVFTEIENYLAVKHIALDKNVGNEIEKLRQKELKRLEREKAKEQEQ